MQVKGPDNGGLSAAPLVEVLVAAGDEAEAEQPLVVLESDKASMEIPAPEAGTITELLVGEGDTVSEGDAIAELETSSDSSGDEDSAGDEGSAGDEDSSGEDSSDEGSSDAEEPT